jgi:hypothetical protein
MILSMTLEFVQSGACHGRRWQYQSWARAVGKQKVVWDDPVCRQWPANAYGSGSARKAWNERKSRTLLRAKSSSSDAPRVDGTDRVDVALVFRSLGATLGTCNASFSGTNAERRGDLGGRGGGWTGSATGCPPVTCDSRGAAERPMSPCSE